MKVLVSRLVLVVAAAAAMSGPGVAVAVGASAAVAVGATPAAAPSAAASNASHDWWFIPKGAHHRPGIPASAARLLRTYSGLWIGPSRERVVYLTFDEGDELGTTARIIGILERAHVRGTFFLTGSYIRANRALTRRLAAHGELVCNHSDTHPDMVQVASSRSAFARQLRATERAYHAATGGRLARFFRPPFGTYSARTLQLARQLGYATVFWSFAHYDYDAWAQPPVSVTLRRILDAGYPGTIYLLHASSRSNVNALAQAINGLKARGFRFGTLDALGPSGGGAVAGGRRG